MTKHVHVESFINYSDAFLWAEKHLMEYSETSFHLEQCEIVFVNNKFRAAVVFSEGFDGD